MSDIPEKLAKAAESYRTRQTQGVVANEQEATRIYERVAAWIQHSLDENHRAGSINWYAAVPKVDDGMLQNVGRMYDLRDDIQYSRDLHKFIEDPASTPALPQLPALRLALQMLQETLGNNYEFTWEDTLKTYGWRLK